MQDTITHNGTTTTHSGDYTREHYTATLDGTRYEVMVSTRDTGGHRAHHCSPAQRLDHPGPHQQRSPGHHRPDRRPVGAGPPVAHPGPRDTIPGPFPIPALPGRLRARQALRGRAPLLPARSPLVKGVHHPRMGGNFRLVATV